MAESLPSLWFEDLLVGVEQQIARCTIAVWILGLIPSRELGRRPYAEARTMVLSLVAYSLSASAICWNIRSHAPASAQHRRGARSLVSRYRTGGMCRSGKEAIVASAAK